MKSFRFTLIKEIQWKAAESFGNKKKALERRVQSYFQSYRSIAWKKQLENIESYGNYFAQSRNRDHFF